MSQLLGEPGGGGLASLVQAHGGEALPIRDLPLPLGLTLVASALVVAASYLAVAVTPSAAERPERRLLPARAASPLLAVLQLLLLGGTGLLVFAAISRDVAGIETVGMGFTPLAFWVGVVLSGLLACALVALGTDDPGREDPALSTGAARRPRELVGILLCPALVYGLFWFELVSGVGFSADWVLYVGLAYLVFLVAAKPLVDRSFGVVDPISTLFGLARRVAPLRWDESGVYYRGVLRGVVGRVPMPVPVCAALFVVLGATTLDNARESAPWTDVVSELGLSGLPEWLLGSVALLVFGILFHVTFTLAVSATRRWLDPDQHDTPVARLLAWSLVPIAVTYLLAHNLTFFLSGWPLLAAQLVDPLALGWDPFEVRHVLLSFVPSPGAVWFPQIALIVGGHVAGVLATHRITARLTTSREALLWSLLPLTALMTAYTVLTLLLLAQPLI